MYIPPAVQDGADISLIDEERRKTRVFNSISILWIDEKGEEPWGYLIPFLLSPLDPETGETLEDPRPLDGRLRFNPKYSSGLRLRK